MGGYANMKGRDWQGAIDDLSRSDRSLQKSTRKRVGMSDALGRRDRSCGASAP